MRVFVALIAAVSTFALMQTASAADLPVKAPVYKAAPIVAPSSNWTGFYVGGHGGYSWGDSDARYDGALFSSSLAALGGTISSSPRGGFGGVHAGYNYQYPNNFLVGVEGDISWGRIRSTIPDVLGAARDGSSGDYIQTTSDRFATVRGRVGYVANSLLLFGTGGVAFTNAKIVSVDYVGPGGPASILTTSANLTGWTAGAGLEYLIAPGWSLRAEYLHSDFGKHTYFPGAIYQSTAESTSDSVRGGLTYHFANFIR